MPKFTKEFKCKLCCRYSFDRRHKLITHQNKCKERKEMCPICFNGLKDKASLKNHMRQNHKTHVRLKRKPNKLMLVKKKKGKTLTLKSQPIQKPQLAKKSIKQTKKYLDTKPDDIPELKLDSRQPNTYYVIDIETNGLASEIKDKVEIIQYCLIKIDLYEDTFEELNSQYFCPRGTIKNSAYQVHGLRKQALRKYRYFTKYDAQYISDQIMGSKNIIAHNVKEDIKVLQIQFRRVKSAFLSMNIPKGLCTQDKAYQYMGINKSLEETCNDILKKGVLKGNEKWHDAQVDAYFTAQVFYQYRGWKDKKFKRIHDCNKTDLSSDNEQLINSI